MNDLANMLNEKYPNRKFKANNDLIFEVYSTYTVVCVWQDTKFRICDSLKGIDMEFTDDYHNDPIVVDSYADLLRIFMVSEGVAYGGMI